MSDNYLNCINPVELARLQSQHDAWKPETHAFLRDAGFAHAERVVEFAAGPGFTSLDLAQDINPAGHITAVDISEFYLQHIQQQMLLENISNLETKQQDITQSFEVDKPFDAAFCRWFLAWVTADLDTVFSNVYRCLKPGGTFAAMEYLTLRSTVHSPKCASLKKYIDAWETFYAQSGGTTEVGTLLTQKFSQAGFTVTHLQCVGGLARSDHRLFHWWRRLYDDFKHTFVEKNLLDQSDLDDLDEYWIKNQDHPDAFVYTPIILQIAGTKAD